MSPFYTREGILRIKERRRLLVFVAGYGVWTSRLPSYVYLGMTLMGAVHGIGTRNAALSFLVPFHRSARMAGSFCGAFAREFNGLPSDLRRNFTRARVLRFLLGESAGV
jgi:hypothetical protein